MSITANFLFPFHLYTKDQKKLKAKLNILDIELMH